MNTTLAALPSWKVTMKTSPNCWTVITVRATDQGAAIRYARVLIGGQPVSVE